MTDEEAWTEYWGYHNVRLIPTWDGIPVQGKYLFVENAEKKRKGPVVVCTANRAIVNDWLGKHES